MEDARMAAKASPVTPSLVAWAVAEDGRQPDSVAERLGVEEDVLLAWASGDAKPSVGQVTRLAAILRRPRALFFLPSPPSDAGLPPSFRHPPGAERDVSQAARIHVRRAKRVQAAVAAALRDGPSVQVPRHDLKEDPEMVGAEARRWSGVTSEDQASWRTGDYTAYAGWRQALEGRGVLVFSIEIGPGDVRGFSSWDDHAPLIVVNASAVSPPARNFTLAHELGHLVTRSDAACIEPTRLLVDVDVERWCERFGASFLMPAEDVRQTARRLGLTQGSAQLNDVRAFMRAYSVSARAAALRLIDLGYAEPALYASVEAAFRPAPKREDDREIKRPPTHIQRETQFGSRALREVLTSLPETTALRVLRMTVADARKIAERIPGIDVTP